MKTPTQLPDLYREAASIFAPKEVPGILEWAGKSVYLSGRVTETPGLFNLDLYPYAREIINAAQDIRNTKITLQFGSQMIKTTLIYVCVAYDICNRPGPVLWVFPSEKAVKKFSKKRWLPLWRDSPELNKYLPLKASGRVDDEAITTLEMQFTTCDMSLVGAGSDANVKSDPYDIVVLDEIDEIDGYARQQAIDRTKGRSRKRIWQSSTPKGEDTGIETERKKGTDEHLYLPCPHCGTMIELLWRDGDTHRFQCDPEAINDGEVVNKKLLVESAFYLPQCCGTPIREHHKRQMLINSKWVSKNDNPEPGHRSFFLPSIYSLILNWGNILLEWYNAADMPGGLQAFINGYLAEPWKDKAIAIRPEAIVACEGNYKRGSTMGRIRVITVDTQRADLRWNIRGYDSAGTYLIDHGDCADFNFIEQLQDKYDAQHVGIDTGGQRTQEVYEAIYERRDRGWIGIDGQANVSMPLVAKRIDPFTGKKKPMQYRGPIVRLDVKVDIFRTEIARRRNGEVPTWKVYKDVAPGYVRELFAERQVEQLKGGRRVLVWKSSRKDNHQFDLEVYQLAMATHYRLTGPRQKDIDCIEAHLPKPSNQPTDNTKQDGKPSAPFRIFQPQQTNTSDIDW